MYGRVLRGGPNNLSLRLSCITILLRLRTVTYRPVGPIGLYIYCAPLPVGYSPTSSLDGIGSARVFYFDQYYIYLLFYI
jgi:hypothetical protein